MTPEHKRLVQEARDTDWPGRGSFVRAILDYMKPYPHSWVCTWEPPDDMDPDEVDYENCPCADKTEIDSNSRLGDCFSVYHEIIKREWLLHPDAWRIKQEGGITVFEALEVEVTHPVHFVRHEWWNILWWAFDSTEKMALRVFIMDRYGRTSDLPLPGEYQPGYVEKLKKYHKKNATES